MPLTHDPEWQKELDFNRKVEIKDSIFGFWVTLIVSALFLAAVVSYLNGADVSDTRAVITIVAASTICLVGAIRSAASVISLKLKILICVAEWVGRKQLSEYHPSHMAKETPATA